MVLRKPFSEWRRMTAFCSCCFMQSALADPAVSQTRPAHELWLNPGFYAYHFQRNLNLNDNAAGLGVEYRISNESALTAGIFHNSNWRTSHYLGYYWQPWESGRARFGAVVGALNGYPGMRRGGWFLAALPAASMEYGRVGLNLFIIPTYKDALYGAIVFQLKLKLY